MLQNVTASFSVEKPIDLEFESDRKACLSPVKLTIQACFVGLLSNVMLYAIGLIEAISSIIRWRG